VTGPGLRAEQVLAALASLHDPAADQELEALKLGLLLEDGLGVVLDDDDLHRLRQDGPAAARAILDRRDNS
jgi:hypothetical protein